MTQDTGGWDGGGSSQGDPGIISKGTFEGTAWLICFGLTIAEFLLVAVVSWHLGGKAAGGWIGGLMVLNLILGHLTADWIFKSLGMSRSGKTIERRGRAGAVAEVDVDDDAMVEARIPESSARGNFWICLVGSVAFPVVATAMLGLKLWVSIMGYALGGLSVVGTISYWFDRKPQAWVDRDGITGYPGPYHLFRRTVPWSDVAACEIVTHYNPFGEPVMIRPVLKGRDGRPLLALYLLGTTVQDQERLAKAIRARLPKLKDDPWDW